MSFSPSAFAKDTRGKAILRFRSLAIYQYCVWVVGKVSSKLSFFLVSPSVKYRALLHFGLLKAGAHILFLHTITYLKEKVLGKGRQKERKIDRSC